MSLLSYTELKELVRSGVVKGVEPHRINGASIDITLGRWLMVERKSFYTIRIRDRAPLMMDRESCEFGYTLYPGQFVLAETQQEFNLPDDIVAEYVLNSSLARVGLNHMLAGYCDPGWHGSVLTLELKNEAQYHALLLTEGDRIGQMKFYRVTPVPRDRSYRARGAYNNRKTVVGPRPRHAIDQGE